MAREYARIRISIADDEDFEDLTADAQWLYTRVLIPEPTLNYAGVADWRPKRLVGKAADMTLDRINAAAAVLEDRRYVLFDLDTEEALVRTYIRSDELLRNPKMAASVVKAYRAVASKVLRAGIVSEVKKARQENPDFSSWASKDTGDYLLKLMARPDLDAVGYTNQIGNPDPVPITNRNTNGITDENTNRNGNQSTSPDYRNEHQSDSVPIPSNSNTQHSPGNIQHGGGYVTGERHQGDDELSNDPPPPRCPNHIHEPTDAPCRACGVARQDREAWDLGQSRREGLARSEAARTAAETRALAIASCDLCDEDGYRAGRLCSHDPADDERAARGMAMVRAAIGGKSEREDES